MPRSKNGSTENFRLIYIVNKMNEELKEKKLGIMFKKLGINVDDILEFEKAGGTKKHHDIVIKFKNGSMKTIEHKGIKGDGSKYNKEKPWSETPQILNGASFNCIRDLFCEYWHSICTEMIKNYFPILPEIPCYDEWKTKDASVGAPKTEFGIMLKEIINSDNVNKDLINWLWEAAIKSFWTNLIEENMVLDQFREELEKKLQNVLQDKNLWMNAYYDNVKKVEYKDYKICKTPQLYNLTIETESYLKNPTMALKLSYNLSSNPSKKFKGEARLRWGNGNGIANIRWNIK